MQFSLYMDVPHFLQGLSPPGSHVSGDLSYSSHGYQIDPGAAAYAGYPDSQSSLFHCISEKKTNCNSNLIYLRGKDQVSKILIFLFTTFQLRNKEKS